MKMHYWWVAAAVCALPAGFQTLAAEEAIVSSGSPCMVGYANGGAGFAFSPSTDIAVTALGYTETSGGATVAIWNADGIRLTSTMVSSNSQFLGSTYYEAIKPVLLSAGQSYYLQGGEANPLIWVGEVTQGFELGPNINYVGGATCTNADGSFPANISPPNYLLLGPNFQYVTPPFAFVTRMDVKPDAVCLSFATSQTETPAFTLLEADNLLGQWRTNTQTTLTTNDPGRNYNLTAPGGGTARFFRIQVP